LEGGVTRDRRRENIPKRLERGREGERESKSKGERRRESNRDEEQDGAGKKRNLG
jgi:hypothetical protein